MQVRWTGLRFVATCVVAAACGGGNGSGAEHGDGSGKEDDLDTSGEVLCSLDVDEPRALSQFVVQGTVQFRCRGPSGKFVETECCTPELDEFVFATGCPARAKFDSGVGADKQCVEDPVGSSEDIDGTLVVPTVCCDLLCDPKADWDDATTMDVCRASNGQFHPNVCCMMNDEQRCGDASFDPEPDALGYRQCWVRTGEFAGLYAPGACCVDSCFDIITSGVEDVPIDCLLALDDECEGATVSDGACRTADGRFTKAVCCAGADGLDGEHADDCYLADLQGEDLAAAGCM